MTKQALYTAALYELGDRNVLTTENAEARRVLDNVYDNVLAECLAMASWNFATQAIIPTADTGLVGTGGTGVAPMGYSHGYVKPTDWVRTIVVSDDSGLVFPLTEYLDAQGHWFADTGEIFVRYVTNDTGLGLNPSAWPQAYTRYVELSLALRVCERITQDPALRDRLREDRDEALQIAITQDATDDAMPRFAPSGHWQALYTAAITALEDQSLLTSRSGEARRALDDVYSNVLELCLAAGEWNFATKTLIPIADTGLTGTAGTAVSPVDYSHGYTKPTDWVRTVMLSDDSGLVFPLTQYYDDQGYWFADTGEIFVRYISNDTGVGLNISEWPQAFTRYVELELAWHVAGRLIRDPEVREKLKERLGKERDEAREFALKQDASNVARPRYAPAGHWQTLYAAVLAELGDDTLLTSRSGEARRALDDVYSNALELCLSAGDWNFATKTLIPTADTGLTGTAGAAVSPVDYSHGYTKPTDWVKTIVVSDDSGLVFPLTQYYDDQNYWFADTGEIFVRYISNDTGVGLNISEWPQAFRRYVELELAHRVSYRLMNDKDLEARLAERRDAALAAAIKQDASNAARPRYAPSGHWTGLYVSALAELGDDELLTTRSGEARRAIDDIYNNTLEYCLAAGPWNFAIETIEPTADTGLTGTAGDGVLVAGYSHGYTKPTDWVRTVMVSDDPYLVFPLTQYYDDKTYWFADTGQIFVRYISNDTGLGLDQADWPQSFTRYVELEIAHRVSYRLTKDRDLEMRLAERRDEALRIALEQNATDAARPRFAPAASWQALYVDALAELGDQELFTTRSGEARRAIQDVYTNTLNLCLSAGSWNFAMETVKMEADTGVEPAFGYTEVFAKPSDWVRTTAVSEDERFAFPLIRYYDDSNFWAADNSPIYVRYVSSDTGLGNYLAGWPIAFRRYVVLELAWQICERLVKDPRDKERIKERIGRDRDKARRHALAQDSINEAQPKFPPPSSWTQARGIVGRRDRGSRSNLTG